MNLLRQYQSALVAAMSQKRVKLFVKVKIVTRPAVAKQKQFKNIEKLSQNVFIQLRNIMRMVCVKIAITQKEELRWLLSVSITREDSMLKVSAKAVI
jgi:hypothetical protein